MELFCSSSKFLLYLLYLFGFIKKLNFLTIYFYLFLIIKLYFVNESLFDLFLHLTIEHQ